MNSFTLKVVTPDGLAFDGLAEQVTVRTTTGDMGVMAGHMNCVAPLGMGQATIITNGQRKYAAAIGGMISVMDGKVTLVCTTFEWADQIDKTRAEASQKRAEAVLRDKKATDTEVALAEARLKRALVRTGVASYKPR